ncbi:MAG: TolC family protein [Gemmatimonadales bacterium]
MMTGHNAGVLAALLVCCAARGAQAQSVVHDTSASPTAQTGRMLTMNQAVTLAIRNNPDFLAIRNNRRNASIEQRTAYGALLPHLSASLSGQYQQGGQQFFNGVSLSANSDVLQSQYDIGVQYSVNASSFITPRVQQANSRAVDADIAGAASTLSALVKQDYLTVLQSLAQAELQDSLVANARAQLELAQARQQVGTGTLLDVRRAEVALSQQKVALLQARNQNEIDKLRLFQQMGVSEPQNTRLVSDLRVGDPLPALDTILALAHRQNPGVVALRERESVANLTVAREKTEYTPTLTVSTGIGGYTYQYRDPNFLVTQAQASANSARSGCIATQEVRQAVGLPNTLSQCSSIQFTDADATRLRAQNSQFPFSFTRAPASISAQLSLPIFDGFAREQRLQEAQVTREDARYREKSSELALNADIRAAYLSLQTAQQTVTLQQENSARARTELDFVQNEYGVGLSTFLDLTTSRAAYAQAETDRINAVYNYHKAFAALESAVGRPLR